MPVPSFKIVALSESLPLHAGRMKGPTMMHRILHGLRADASFSRFLVISASVAVIDIGLLFLLHTSLGLHLYVARVFSFAAAIGASYLMNRHFNFRQRTGQRHPGHELMRFYGVHAVGNAANYAIFVSLLEGFQASGFRPEEHPGLVVLALWVGGMIGVSANFMLSRHLVFDRR